jgi:STE24 endopeptidase
MNPVVLSVAFSAAILASLLVNFWLATRQMRHVAAHRGSVPSAFVGVITLESHQKAADYALAKGRLGIVSSAFASALLIGWTLLGGLSWLNGEVRALIQPRLGDMAYQLALFGAFALIATLIDLPLSLYATFRLEQRFGFNNTSVRLYVRDALVWTGVAIAIGGPFLALVLWLMQVAGAAWWVWVWAVWIAFQALLMIIWPLWIAPLFNKFVPFTDATLIARVSALMSRCGFRAKGFFVMDGSKRSAHSNAYFTGLGAGKRVVFYDTLVAKLSAGEMEAVLAHELGHFKHRHLFKSVAAMGGFSLGALALLGWLATQSGFYLGLNVLPNAFAPNNALTLLLFALALPPFGYFVGPLFSMLSRRHEYEADAYARTVASATDLVRALVKLVDGNAGTLTSDPLYVRFHYSHPPTLQRIEALGVDMTALQGATA